MATSAVCPIHHTQCKRLEVSKDGPNKGRKFFICQQSGCKHFEWEGSQPASQPPTSQSISPSTSSLASSPASVSQFRAPTVSPSPKKENQPKSNKPPLPTTNTPVSPSPQSNHQPNKTTPKPDPSTNIDKKHDDHKSNKKLSTPKPDHSTNNDTKTKNTAQRKPKLKDSKPDKIVPSDPVPPASPPLSLPQQDDKSPPKTPTKKDEKQKNAAVLSKSPVHKNPKKAIDHNADDATTTTTTTTTTNKKMLSLATLNGKGLAPAVVRPPGKETPLEKVVVDLEIVTAERFGPTRKIKNKEVEEVFRSITGHKLDGTSFMWSFPITQLDALMQKLKPLKIKIKPIPNDVLNALKKATAQKLAADKNGTMDFSDMPPKLFSGLLGFQVEGLMFAARNGGRCLIADEMGLGKTIQALAIASCYRSEWPLLIVCPSSMKNPWKNELEKWLDLYEPEVNVVNNGKDKLTSLVNIISYDLAVKAEDACKFKVVICDESHYLKSLEAARTKAIVPIIQATPRAILLTGTPALARPVELYPQLLALGKQVFKNFKQFGERYCAAHKGPWGWDYKGNSHLPELYVVLSQTVMIRRLKADVLSDLPGKHRSMVSIEVSQDNTDNLRGMLAEAKKLGIMAKKSHNKHAESDKRQLIMQLYVETARAKLDSVRQYVLELVAEEPNRKFLVFAHHQEVLDGIEEALRSKRVSYMRIDGGTRSNMRQTNVHEFQTFKKPQVAVLSMTAAGTGLTLNAASLVIFVELYWTPGVLRQCEDRVHRIGQKENCDIRYLVAKNTFDENIWPLICHKLEVVGSALDGQEEVLDATKVDYISAISAGGELEDDPIDDEFLTAVFSNDAKKRSDELSEDEDTSWQYSRFDDDVLSSDVPFSTTSDGKGESTDEDEDLFNTPIFKKTKQTSATPKSPKSPKSTKATKSPKSTTTTTTTTTTSGEKKRKRAKKDDSLDLDDNDGDDRGKAPSKQRKKQQPQKASQPKKKPKKTLGFDEADKIASGYDDSMPRAKTKGKAAKAGLSGAFLSSYADRNRGANDDSFDIDNYDGIEQIDDSDDDIRSSSRENKKYKFPDDEAYAKRLQAQYDDEDIDDVL